VDEVIRGLAEKGIPVWKYDLEKVFFRKPGQGALCAIFECQDGKFCATYPTDANFVGTAEEAVAFVEGYLACRD
jgi:hypothetical protein